VRSLAQRADRDAFAAADDLVVADRIEKMAGVWIGRIERTAEARLACQPPIEPQQLGEVVQTLEKRFARKLNPTVVVDPSLIGGIRVVVGDEVLDTSIRARLEQMRAALTA